MQPMQTSELIDSSMIVFNKDSETDILDSDGDVIVAGWGGWAERSAAFINKYKVLTGNPKSCNPNDPSSGIDQYCKVDLSNLGPCSISSNGYDQGKPCIFLKLNKIYGVQNDPYNDVNDLPDEMPLGLKDHIATQADKNQVWILH
jgi:hypothetical protein